MTPYQSQVGNFNIRCLLYKFCWLLFISFSFAFLYSCMDCRHLNSIDFLEIITNVKLSHPTDKNGDKLRELSCCDLDQGLAILTDS